MCSGAAASGGVAIAFFLGLDFSAISWSIVRCRVRDLRFEFGAQRLLSGGAQALTA
jgi:hypothetical protein